MEEKYVILGNIMKDPDQANKLLAMSADEAAVFLRETYGLEFTIDELNDVAAGIKKALSEDTSDELTEDALESVAGGKKSGAYNAGYYIGKGIKIVGTGIGIVGGLVALGVISW